MVGVYNVTGNTVNQVYNKNGNILSVCYDVQGNQLGRGHAVSNNATKSLLMIPDIPTGTQGLACDSITQSIAQLYAGRIYILNVSDGSAVDLGSFNNGHGDTGQFAPTKSESQSYPLLYVCCPDQEVDGVPYCFLLEVICDSSSATLKRIYAIPTTAGITSTTITAIDFDNNIVYMVNASTYYGTTDYMYISAWDMSEYEPLENTTWRPTDGSYVFTNKLDEFQLPFVPEAQACTFFDGMIAILSDKSNVADKYIQFVDVETKSVYLNFNNQMPAGELEGIGFLYNNTTSKYDMIVSHRWQGTTEYYRYEFN